MRKVFLGALLGVGFCLASAYAAEIVVKDRPPAPLIDDHGKRPDKDHVWINGYHKWDGHAFVWVPGRWEAAPHPNAKWEAAHWRHDHDNWVFVEGRWK